MGEFYFVVGPLQAVIGCLLSADLMLEAQRMLSSRALDIPLNFEACKI